MFKRRCLLFISFIWTAFIAQAKIEKPISTMAKDYVEYDDTGFNLDAVIRNEEDNRVRKS